MPDSNGAGIVPIGTQENSIKKVNLAVFHETSKRVRTQIGDLYHSREPAIHEHWSFNNCVYCCPQCALVMKTPHWIGVFFRY